MNPADRTARTAFTDGACSLNGAPGARAAFAAVIVGAGFDTAEVKRGQVRHTTYAFVDSGDPARGFRGTMDHIAPSNNRGELLGIAYALLSLLQEGATGRIEIVTDSLISAQTLLQWLPDRLAKGTENRLKNLDLLMIAWRLLAALRKQAASVGIAHVRSHQKAPQVSDPAYFHYYGNRLADRHAARALADTSLEFEIVRNAEMV